MKEIVICEHYFKCKLIDSFDRACAHSYSHDKYNGCDKNECEWLSEKFGMLVVQIER